MPGPNPIIRHSLELALLSYDILIIRISISRNLNRTYLPGYIELIIQGPNNHHLFTFHASSTAINIEPIGFIPVLYLFVIRPILLVLSHVAQGITLILDNAIQQQQPPAPSNRGEPRLRPSHPRRNRRPVPPPQHQEMDDADRQPRTPVQGRRSTDPRQRPRH